MFILMLWDFKNEFQQTTCVQMLLQEKFKLKEKLYMKSKLSSPPPSQKHFFSLVVEQMFFFYYYNFYSKTAARRG